MEKDQANKYQSKFDKLCNIMDFISGILLYVLTGVIIIEVVGRYFFNHPFSFTSELSLLIFPWVVFLTCISVTHNNEHIAVTFFREKFSEKFKTFSEIFSEVLIFIFILLLFIGSIQLGIAVANQTVPTLQISKLYFYLSLIVAFAIILYMLFYKAMIRIFKKKGGGK